MVTIWSALMTTSSGTRSLTTTPVACSTLLYSDSKCSILTVLMTLIPAFSKSCASSWRLRFFDPGAFVCASSFTFTK